MSDNNMTINAKKHQEKYPLLPASMKNAAVKDPVYKQVAKNPIAQISKVIVTLLRVLAPS